RSFGHGDSLGVVAEVGIGEGFGTRSHGRMDDRVQSLQTQEIGEDIGAQHSPVDSAVAGQKFGFILELIEHGLVGGAAGFEDFVTQVVHADDEAAQIGEAVPHEAFAAGESAGESYVEHANFTYLVPPASSGPG